jgi:hypothetical protein
VPHLQATAAADPRRAAAVTACLGVRGSDDVLVLCNEPHHPAAEALAAAAREPAPSIRVLEYPAASRPSQEPPAPVAEAMLGAPVVFAVTAFSISHTRARRADTDRGAGIASCPRSALASSAGRSWSTTISSGSTATGSPRG